MRPSTRLAIHLIAAILVSAAPIPGAAAQEAPPLARSAGARSLSGAVIHDESAVPIQSASVVLAPVGQGILTGDGSTGVFLASTRATVTDADGRYHFDGVPAGSYVLRVHRLGFRPATVELELRSVESRFSVGLSIVPVRLTPVAVSTESAEPFARLARTADAESDARLAALRQRQRRYLATDVREITHSDVAEGVTLGETDLFRALQRMPGVSARNEFSAELWTRNARWDRTRVLFDGMPLFNPVHAAGVFGAVDPNAIGAAFLHPGVRPANIGEGGAGVLDIRSRPGGGTGALRGMGELSLVSARAALDRRVDDGRAAWMVAARRTYLDLVVPLVLDGPDGNLPYHFTDIAGRYDRELADGRALEVSALHAQDRLTGDVPDVAQGNRAHWGNDIARVTLESPHNTRWFGAAMARHTLGVSRYDGEVRPHEPGAGVAGYSESADPPVRSTVTYLMLGTELAPQLADGAPTTWSAGWELVHQRASSKGAARMNYVGDMLDMTTSSLGGAVTNLALWGERRVRPSPRFTLAPGLRVELGTPLRGTGPLRVAPRLSARWAPGDSTTLFSAALGRSYQYTQAIEGQATVNAAAPGFVPLWLIADADTPPLRTDLFTVGVERWLGTAWHASVNAYARRSGGVLVPDPRPTFITEHALFVEGQERAHGAEASLRRIQGRWTVAFGYAYGSARMEAAGESYAPPEDRRHVVDVTTMARVGSGLRLGAAYTSASGSPYTRLIYGSQTPTATGGYVWNPPSRFEAPGASRFPRYAAVDLLLDWSGIIGRTRTGMFLQLHNVFSRENPSSYEGTYCTSFSNTACVQRDSFGHGFPIVPIVGFRLSF